MQSHPLPSLRSLLRCGCLVGLALLLNSSALQAQKMLDRDLEVMPELQPLDEIIRQQLVIWLEKCDAAESEHGRESKEYYEATERYDPITVHGEAVLGYATEYRASPAAFVCLCYILDWGEGRPRHLAARACAEILDHEKDDPRLSWLCGRCVNPLGLAFMEDFLTRLLNQSQNRTVRAAAAFHLAQLYDHAASVRLFVDDHRERFRKAGLVRGIPGLDALKERSLEELTAQRAKMLELVKREYADEKGWRGERTIGRLDYRFHEPADQPTYGELAERLSFAATHLRVGCTAPDFEGTDLGGQPFRLSDCRGKTVLLLFMSQGCNAMYPALRNVQERFGPQTLVLLGVMLDQSPKLVQQAIDAGDITWRCVWDGPRNGPIATLYQVKGVPTLLLLDPSGRIRATHLRDEPSLAKAIEEIVRK